MRDICVKGGFCLPQAKVQAIWSRARIDAKNFAFQVLRAEGFEHPEYEPKFVRALSRAFVGYFGEQEIEIE